MFLDGNIGSTIEKSMIKQTVLKYHRRTPSLASSNNAFVAGSIGRN